MRNFFIIVILYYHPHVISTSTVDYFLTNQKVYYFQYNDQDPLEWLNAINPACTTVFFIHGWYPYFSVNTFYPFKDVVKEYNTVPSSEGCYNTITIRWRAASKFNYFTAASEAVGSVTDEVVDFIIDLHQRKLLPGRIDCTGHSLGAHICGNVGRKLKSTKPFHVVTGLDPAGPTFTALLLVHNLSEYKLRVGDGALVATLMTNGGEAGTSEHLGDVNFIVGGGKKQRGCLNSPFCSHNRAVHLFKEAVLRNHFVVSGDNGSEAIFGRHLALDTPPGIYAFNTKAYSPYGPSW